MKKLLFILLFIPFITASNLIYSQEYLLTEHEEFKVSITGDVYYDAHFKDGVLIYEELYNDDFELDVTVFKGGDGFYYFDDIKEYTNEMANDLGYRNSRFFESEVSYGVKSHFLITYSREEDCNIIFGVIQDSSALRQYEIELYCYNISLKEATSIINSIDID